MHKEDFELRTKIIPWEPRPKHSEVAEPLPRPQLAIHPWRIYPSYGHWDDHFDDGYIRHMALNGLRINAALICALKPDAVLMLCLPLPATSWSHTKSFSYSKSFWFFCVNFVLILVWAASNWPNTAQLKWNHCRSWTIFSSVALCWFLCVIYYTLHPGKESRHERSFELGFASNGFTRRRPLHYIKITHIQITAVNDFAPPKFIQIYNCCNTIVNPSRIGRFSLCNSLLHDKIKEIIFSSTSTLWKTWPCCLQRLRQSPPSWSVRLHCRARSKHRHSDHACWCCRTPWRRSSACGRDWMPCTAQTGCPCCDRWMMRHSLHTAIYPHTQQEQKKTRNKKKIAAAEIWP